MGYPNSNKALLTWEEFSVLGQASSITRKPLWEFIKSVEDSRSAPPERQQGALLETTSPKPIKVFHARPNILEASNLSEHMPYQSAEVSFEERKIFDASNQPEYTSPAQRLEGDDEYYGSYSKFGNIFANDDSVQWEQLEDSSSVIQTQEQIDTSIPIVSQSLPPLSNITAMTSNLGSWISAPMWETDSSFDYAQGLSVSTSRDASSAATTSAYPPSDYSSGSYFENGVGFDTFQQTLQYSAGDDLALAPIIQGPGELESIFQISDAQSSEHIVSVEQMPWSQVRRTSVNLNSDTLPVGHDQITPADIFPARRDRNKRCSRQMGKAPRSGVQKQIKRRARAPQQQYACWKCAFDHKQCHKEPDLGGCKRCASFKSIRGSCFYTKVVEIYLFRTLTDPNVPRPKLGLEEHIMNRITRRGIPKVRTIYITQGYGTILPLQVQDFDASSINLDEIPNNERNLYNVPFQLVDVEESTRTMQKFVISSIKHYIKDRLRASDHVTQAFFDLGLQAANDKSQHATFIHKVLYLWTAARMMEGGWYFTRGETLGLTSNGEENIPLIKAPLVDYQFAGIMRDRILVHCRDVVLKELQDKIYEHQNQNLFAIFIASFVLLNTYELLSRQQIDFGSLIRAPNRYPSLDLLRGIHHGAKVLLTHFHDCIRGLKAIDNVVDSSEEAEMVAQRMQIKDYQLEALRTLIPKVRHQVPRFIELIKTKDYEVDHWFTGQLFIPNWTAPATMVV